MREPRSKQPLESLALMKSSGVREEHIGVAHRRVRILPVQQEQSNQVRQRLVVDNRQPPQHASVGRPHSALLVLHER